MFGETHEHYHKHETTVIEKRAATDDSIRILDEMYEKTIDRIISHVKVTNSLVEFDAIFMNNPVTEDIQTHIKFMINGQEQILKLEITSREYHNYSKNWDGAQQLFDKIYDLMAIEISHILCESIAKTTLFKNI